MPQGDGTNTGVRPPPLWRYDGFPLTSPGQPPSPQPGFFSTPPHWWRLQQAWWRYNWTAVPLLSAWPGFQPQTMALAATGNAVSAGNADLVAPGLPGTFAFHSHTYLRLRPSFRYDGPLLAGPASVQAQTLALDATGAAVSAGAADLNITMALAAAGAAASSGNADLGRVWAAALAATGAAASTGSAALILAGSMAGPVVAVASSSASVAVSVALAGPVVGSGSVVGTLTEAVSLSAVTLAALTTAAILLETVTVVGSSSALTYVTGSVTTGSPIAGRASAFSGTSANLALAVVLAGPITIAAVIAGSLIQVIQDISVITGPLFSAWSFGPPSPRWSVAASTSGAWSTGAVGP